MIEKISGTIGIGLVIGNKTIGILFGGNSDVVSIVVLVVGILLMLFAITQYEKKRSIEIDEDKAYKENTIKLIEEIARQDTLERCIGALEKYFEETCLHSKYISSELEKINENIIALKDTQDKTASDFKVLLGDEITSKISDLRNAVSQKLDAVCDSNEKYGWVDSDRKVLLELEKSQGEMLCSSNKLLNEVISANKIANDSIEKSMAEIQRNLEGFSFLPAKMQDIVADTFDEVEAKFVEYTQNSQDTTERSFDNMEEMVGKVNRKNADLIRKIEDEMLETRKMFENTSEALNIQIKELTNQTKLFEQTMDGIMCQLMKMSANDAKMITEMLNGN
nr:hypothetical protein [uncultured Lachnoanaerobaculum sp.]